MRRRLFALCLALGCGVAGPARAVDLESEEGYALVRQMLSRSQTEREAAAQALIEAGDRTLVAALVDSIFYTPREQRDALYAVLASLTGESLTGYYDWVEYVGAHESPRPKPGYANFKVAAFAQIDARYREIFYSGAPVRLRLEEIVSGGVPVAGIPALDNPPTIKARKARYLAEDELVFGVELGGEARAYPVRFLSWHEMANDELGGEPITLSFCTLCGSGIVYSGITVTGENLTFDTSGLLYRSNKLMLDRETRSLWSNLTGSPVVGRMVASGASLEVLPSTLTTWGDWRERHPRTTTLDLEGVRSSVDPRFSFDYSPGAADRARRGVAFPVWLKNERLDRNAEIYALRIGRSAKAYPLDRLFAERLVNDSFAGRSLVLIADEASQSVRAYDSGGRIFESASRDEAIDAEGIRWKIGESSLVPVSVDSEFGPLERLAGHVAFWFGWYAFYPQSEVYE